ncbi:hypothetical protein ACVIW2_004076 [Bradyrhizobium huanghuaihaiense]|uniref:MarR family transcriptional regulator n=2 Tax=Bradyrhizobium TaxID=374 RepID=A0ABV4FUT7_9BRAD|nr:MULTISPECIES: hypothetical protein [Bradyrhizobium]MBP1059060.1 hypothetical protein [Bradyrhizobium japonicum]MBP1090177.1 hypothetical protein [Bradyrhizobium japonicum]MCD9111785.1 hypothetical protein [Bradyrhizobium japonicum]MCD9260606.1 hypothetical protein [Bradyrhizobium japonicum SEMIA 5079]MCD9298581.1 hypothetical protein [Bradyrhizobium diazoefficiens]
MIGALWARQSDQRGPVLFAEASQPASNILRLELLRSDATQAACIGNTLPEGAARQSGSTQALYMVDQINRRMSCDLRSYHANALGITGPQMMILMALTELEEDGVPVNAVAKLMRVESGFITKQSRELEVSSSCAGNPT